MFPFPIHPVSFIFQLARPIKYLKSGFSPVFLSPTTYRLTMAPPRKYQDVNERNAAIAAHKKQKRRLKKAQDTVAAQQPPALLAQPVASNQGFLASHDEVRTRAYSLAQPLTDDVPAHFTLCRSFELAGLCRPPATTHSPSFPLQPSPHTSQLRSDPRTITS